VVIDQSSFAKMEVSGRDAPAFMQRLANNDLSGPPGTVVYTQLLNEKGGIEADVTIESEFSYYVITRSGSVRAQLRR
jgi:sarcosine dehydrogenase